MSVPTEFQGFAVDKGENWNKPKLVSYEHKKILPTDVVVKNICCGLCGSDIHTIQEQWGKMKRNDLVVGHEIVGHVVQVGEAVTEFKIGQRVGIGPLSASCGDCKRCKSDNEQYCSQAVPVYNGKDGFADNYITQGGYASHLIAKEQFVFPIPEALDSVSAAPLMCAGMTVYSPLKRCLAGKKNPVVGIIGIGGLGHLALQFAKAMGAEVYAFSRGYSKKEEALGYGVEGFVATGEEKDWDQKLNDKFDLILNCASQVEGMTLQKYLNCLTVQGQFINVGLPPVGKNFEISAFSFLSNGSTFGTSLLASKSEVIEMLEVAVEKGVRPKVEEIPISEAAAGKALERCEQGDVRYRFVFTEFDKAFGKANL